MDDKTFGVVVAGQDGDVVEGEEKPPSSYQHNLPVRSGQMAVFPVLRWEGR